jgi:GNAT superfamily N-acetyltransferase
LPDELFVATVDASELHELRRRVLRGDNPLANVDDPRDTEEDSLHVAGFLGDRLVVSSSFYTSTSPTAHELTTYQLRYMATDFDVQGRGYGERVLNTALDILRRRGVQQVWANARDSALGFYSSTGWSVLDGTQHLSHETQLPHTAIVKNLDATA